MPTLDQLLATARMIRAGVGLGALTVAALLAAPACGSAAAVGNVSHTSYSSTDISKRTYSYSPSFTANALSAEEVQRLGMPQPQNTVEADGRVVTQNGVVTEDSRRATMTIDANHSTIRVLPRTGAETGRFTWNRTSGKGTFYFPTQVATGVILVTGSHNEISLDPAVAKLIELRDLGTDNRILGQVGGR